MQHALVVGVGDGRVDAHVAGTHAVLEVEHAGFGAFVPEVEGFLGGGRGRTAGEQAEAGDQGDPMGCQVHRDGSCDG